MQRKVTIGTVFALAVTLVAAPAFAGAFRIPESGAAAMGQGNAFVGQADDPSAVHHNPAAITGLEGIQFMGGLTMVTPESEFEGVAAEKETFYPPFLFYSNRIKQSDWWIGFGINAPFGLGTEWGSDAPFNAFFRGTVTPVTPVDIITKTTLEVAKIAPVAAYQINDNFSIGFGPEYYQVQEVSYKGGSTLGGGNGYTYSMEGDGDGLGFVLSGLYTVNANLRFGLAWHSGVTAELSGKATSFPDSGGVPYTGNASLDLNLPDTMALGVHYRISNVFSVNLDLDQTQWSDYDKLAFKRSNGSSLRTIEKDYEDVLAIRLGGAYKIDEKWTVRAGLHSEPSPAPDETYDPRLPDADASSITVGVGYDTKKYAFNIAYMALSKDDRDVDSDEPNTLLNTLFDGTYKTTVDLIGMDVTLRF